MLLDCLPNIVLKMDAVCVMYPHHMYRDVTGHDLSIFVELKTYWASRGVKINYLDTPYADFVDNDIYGCNTCKQARKAIIDPYVNTKRDGTGILTGVTFYDTLAYINMLLYHTNFDLENFESIPSESKTFLIKTLHKIKPREALPSGKIMIRPLLRFDEPEIREHLRYKKIPYIDDLCKISRYKFKRQYFNALNVYHKNKRHGKLPSYDDIIDMLKKHKILLDELPFNEMVTDSFFIDC
jgi:tRNA(Ile)-lysidine synthase TilS/MesJ